MKVVTDEVCTYFYDSNSGNSDGAMRFRGFNIPGMKLAMIY
jgi:hypothetical protein